MQERGTGRGAIGRAAGWRRRACAAAHWALLLAVPAVSAQPAAVDADAAAANGPAPADLVVANRTIITLRAPVSGASPAQPGTAPVHGDGGTPG